MMPKTEVKNAERALCEVVLGRLDAPSWLATTATCRWARAARAEPRAFVFGPEDEAFVVRAVLQSSGTAWAAHSARVRGAVPLAVSLELPKKFKSVSIESVTVCLPEDTARLESEALPPCDEIHVFRYESVTVHTMATLRALQDESHAALAAFSARSASTKIVFKQTSSYHEAKRVIAALPEGTPVHFAHVFALVFDSLQHLFPANVTVGRLALGARTSVRDVPHFKRLGVPLEFAELAVSVPSETPLLDTLSVASIARISCISVFLDDQAADGNEALRDAAPSLARLASSFPACCRIAFHFTVP